MAIIWTNHVRERIKQRGLSPAEVDQTLRFPDEVRKSTNSQTFRKSYSGYTVVAAIKRQGNDWIIASAWKKPYGQKTVKPNFLERIIGDFLLSLEKLFRN